MVLSMPNLSYEQPLLRSWNSGTVTDYTFYLGPLDAGPYRAFRFEMDLQEETGTTTVDAELEYYSEANGEWTDWLDGAGTVMKLNNYGNGESGRRFLEVGPGAVDGADADNVLVVGNNVYYNAAVMPVFRVAVTIGGTAVSAIISASVYWKN